jgi:SAM-dependent methyltransferase
MMDQPGLDEAEHRAALAGLRRVNWLSGGVPALWRQLQSLVQFGSADRPLRVLDVACGSGDIVLRLARRARNSGLPIRFDGCDLSETALQLGCQTSRNQGILNVRFFQHDALRDPFPDGYDVVICSLFLHHLAESDAVLLLKSMAQAARRAILVDDLLRSRWGYVLCWVGCRIVSRSLVVRTDGPLSVRAAFTLNEARHLASQAGLGGVQLQRHWPERFLLSWSRG